MIFLWIFLGILIFFALLALLNVHLILEYQEDVTLTLSVLFFKYALFPSKKKKETPSGPKKQRKEKKKEVSSNGETKPKEKGVLEKLSTLRDLLGVLLKKTLGHLQVRASRIRIRVATGDAASTAILFGAVNAGMVFLLETLDRFVKIKTYSGDDIEVRPDYLAEKTTVDVRLLFSLRVWHLCDILLKTFMAHIHSKKKKVRS
mgnify:CR=1 FL=1